MEKTKVFKYFPIFLVYKSSVNFRNIKLVPLPVEVKMHVLNLHISQTSHICLLGNRFSYFLFSKLFFNLL